VVIVATSGASADDVRVFASALTATTIQRAYSQSRASHLVDMVLKLDGNGEHVQVPSTISLGAPLTFSAWVYARDPYGVGQTMFDASDSVTGAANSSVINVRLQYNGRMVFTVDSRPDTGGSRMQLVSPDAFPRARWTFVAITEGTGGTVNMYWDGMVVASQTGFVVPPTRTRPHVAIGRDFPGANATFWGSLDAVTYTRAVWSQADVVNRMGDTSSFYKQVRECSALCTLLCHAQHR
jgi:hypothetical protein